MFGSSNVFGLCGLVAAAQHHNQHIATLQVVPAPAGAEQLAHFHHPVTDRPDVTKVAALRLFKSARKAPVRQAVGQATQPVVEVVGAKNSEHAINVIERLQTGKGDCGEVLATAAAALISTQHARIEGCPCMLRAATEALVYEAVGGGKVPLRPLASASGLHQINAMH